MTTTTTNMSLVLPDVSITIGATWASLLNASLILLDAHDHTTGKGSKITPSGINISSDLTFASNNATNLRTIRMYNNSAFTTGVNDRGCLYVLNNELYFIDGVGNAIQVTSGGLLNLGASITSLGLNDSTFTLKYFGDVTRQMRFNASQIPTGTTRIYSLPDPGANDTLVSLISTQSLTNKTFDSTSTMTGVKIASLTPNGSNTITFPAATDTVVTLAASQTLTNKVLSDNSMATVKPDGVRVLTLPITTDTLVAKNTTDTLTNKTLTGAVITDYEDFTGVVAPASPTSGKLRVYAKTDNKLYKKDSSGIEQQVGSGSGAGGINYISNADFEDGTITGWATYADVAGATPVDGTGGSPTVTFASTSTTPLRGTFSGLFTKDAANRQGEGFSYDFTLSAADVAKTLQITFDSTVSSGTFASGDLTVYVYDVTNSVLITPSSVNVPTGLASQYSLCFQTTTSTSYRLIFHVASTSASAYTLRFDQVSISPIVRPMVAGRSDWQTYTPTGTMTTNTTYTGLYARDGCDLLGNIHIAFTGAPNSVTLSTISLPTNLTIDTTKLLSTTAKTNIPFSECTIKSAGVFYTTSAVWYQSTTAIQPTYDNGSGVATAITQAAPGTIANGDWVDISFRVPITQWSSNITLASTTPAIEYVYNTSTTDAADTTSFGTGAAGIVGILRTTTLTTLRLKRIQFNNPIQPTDRVVIEIDVGGVNQWYPVESALAWQYSGISCNLSTTVVDSTIGYSSGMGLIPVSGSNTKLDVCFNRYAVLRTDDGGYNWSSPYIPAGTKWRVAKYSSIGAAELAPATSISSGTISRENIWTAYTPTISAGFGTATSVSFIYRVLGNSLKVEGIFTAGTVAASIASVTFPTGFNISTIMPGYAATTATTTCKSVAVNSYANPGTANGSMLVLLAPTTASDRVYFGVASIGGSGNLTPQNGAAFASSAVYSISFEVPIV